VLPDDRLAFCTLAVVQVLNNSIPPFVRTSILHESASGGDPLASTVFGSLVIQLLEACIAVGPILLLTWLSGHRARDIYPQPGVAGRWLAFSIAFFVLFYAFTVTIPLRPGSFTERLLPTNGALDFGRLIALTPALLLMVISNGFEEELLFRGLFLPRYEPFFGARLSNVLQAAIFALAHAGVTYTPATFLFLLIAVFPLGLFFGYVMRATNSILAPSIFHAAFDLAIYLVFLSYAT
jgi:membrane protease YdiL (CAAX protease family)